jgi:hypothetical protein
MSFYIRKSLRAGPFRFNFSKSGVGVSTGFAGFRIGTGPRGNYIHMGRNGLYYRATLPSGNKSSKRSRPVHSSQPIQPSAPQDSTVEMKDIESVDVLQLQDSSSAELLAEINSKHKKFQLRLLAIILSVIALVTLLAVQVQIWVYAVAIPLAIAVVYFAHRQDQLAKTVILFYELEGEIESAFQAVHNAFKELSDCAKAWHVASSGKVTSLNEQKRQAGASSLVQRSATRLILQAPTYVSTNVTVPAIPVGKQTLYFFPDRILVYESGRVGAVSYADIELELDNTRFIESDAVPSDAQIVGQTWKYVNKRGGPDKRFKDNRQLPIALYSEIYFKNKTGLNELIQISKPNVGSSLAEAFKKLSSIQQGLGKSSV